MKETQTKRTMEKISEHFFKEDMQMAKRHMKRCLTSLIIREMQIKTAMRCYLIPARMTTIRKSANSKWWRGNGKKEPLLPCW